MLDIFRIKFPSFGKITDWIQGNTKRGSWHSSLFLGIIFALAFCPYSAVLYFGMLIPISISSATGLYLPLVFAIATGLPVIIVAYLLAFSVSGIGNFYHRMQSFQKWLNRVVAFVFIAVGLYYVYIHFIK